MYQYPLKNVKNELLGTIGSYDIHFLSGAPRTVNDYLTIIRPFEPAVWAFVVPSFVVVSMSLIFIDKLCSRITHESKTISTFQSMNMNGNYFWYD